MDSFQKNLTKREVLIAALVVSSLVGCSAALNRPPTASPTARLPEVAPITRHPVHLKQFSTHVPSPAPLASPKQTSATILSQIHQSNLAEIALGKLGREKASKSEVRAYADQLVQDHTHSDTAVVALAQKSGVQLRNASNRHQSDRHELVQEEQFEKLKSANNTDFDRRFLEQTVSTQARLIQKLQHDREDASDDQLEALIDEMMPILNQHQELAQILLKKE